jgi:hypothetical protein
MRKGNIIAGSPVVHGPVGDPLQIYADRFSGPLEIAAPQGESGPRLWHKDQAGSSKESFWSHRS